MSVLSKRKIEFREDFAVGMIIGIVVLMIIIMVAVGVSLQAMNNLGDSYFVSDKHKLVLTMNKDVASFEEGEYEPDLTHIVYYYSGDKINNVRIYFAYDSRSDAKYANKKIDMSDKPWASKKRQLSRYVVFDLTPDQYEGLTTNEVKDSIVGMRAAGGAVDIDTVKK
ncbi:hypothetical protein IJS18_03050 [Candidatus Saccharibacteria bacterium]|nr:hypothetical protein [Candidatus Saccharibacteria bacterium]